MIKKCKVKTCPLYLRREIPYSGNTRAKVVFIGESPGPEDEKLGQPFSSHKSGNFLKEIVAEIGLNWDDLLIMNASRCLINKKSLSAKEITHILQCCRPKVEFILKENRPNLIVTLGDIAMKQVLKKSGITKHRGQFYWSKEFNCWVFPTYHPFHICSYNVAMKPRFTDDIKMVREFMDNNYMPLSVQKNNNYMDTDIPEYWQKLNEAAEDWLKNGANIGIDIESQGKDIYSKNFLMISYSISAEPEIAYNIQLYEETTDTVNYDKVIHWPRLVGKKMEKIVVYIRKCINFDRKIDLLKKLLESSNIKKYAMTTFDIQVFRNNGFTVNCFAMDIQACANLISENLYSQSDLATLQTGFTAIRANYKKDFKDTHNKNDMIAEYLKDRNGVIQYACGDADVTRQIAINIKELLKKYPGLLRYAVKFTMAAENNVLVPMMGRGVAFDWDKLPEAKKYVDKLMYEYEHNALRLVPHRIIDKHRDDGLKLTRDLFVQDILFSPYGFRLKPIKKTKTGYSVDKESRKKLLGTTKSKKTTQFIELYDKYLETHTISTRYLNGFDKYAYGDFRLHSSFTLATTVTGRVASRSPNLQNIPKRGKLANEIRKLIIPSKGYLFIAADVAQSELRWMAHLSSDPEMIRVFNTNEDIHTNTARSLSVKKWDTLTDKEKSDQRRNAKAINFGLLYKMGVNGFTKYAKVEYGIDISIAEATKWIDIFFNKYKYIRKYHDETINFCRKYGYIEHCLGRIRRLPEIHSDDRYLRFEAERQAVNFPIQGPSSDTVLLAAGEINKLGINPDEFRLVLFIHDELVFEIKESIDLNKYAKIILHHMENPPLERDFGVKLKVPLRADIKIGKNLNDLKEMALT